MLHKLRHGISLILSISGYVPKHATVARTSIMGASLAGSLLLSYCMPGNPAVAIGYFAGSTALYIGYLICIFPKQFYRQILFKYTGNEEMSYRVHEAILGFLFFHNGASIGYFSTAFADSIPITRVPWIVGIIAGILFLGGFGVKLWATHAVSVDIYYLKDMFMGRKISDFIVSGPYRYFNNPMYGVGQLQSYAIGLWYMSWEGLVVAAVNQALVFCFYFIREKPFIIKTYLSHQHTTASE